MSILIATQVEAGIPIWDLIAEGVDVGVLTDFPGEGPMATVRNAGREGTVRGVTMHETFKKASELFADLEQSDDFIEDEDGSEAFVRMLERRDESRADWDENGFHCLV